MYVRFVVVLGLLAGCADVFNLERVKERCTVAACEAAGGTCGASGVCELTCTGASCVCPPALSCLIDARAADLMIDCSRADDCTIRCLGEGHCENAEVRCGGGICSVNCTSEQFSCGGIEMLCGGGSCSLTCAQLGSCQGTASVHCGLAESCTTTCNQDACTALSVSCEQAKQCSVACDPGGNNTCNNATLMCEQAASCELDCGGRPGCTSS